MRARDARFLRTWKAILPLLSSLATGGCDPGGFKLVESGTTRTLRSVFVESRDRIVISGGEGCVLSYDGEVVTDTSTDADATVEVPDFYGVTSDGERVTVVGDRGIALTLDGGGWRRDDSHAQERLLTLLRPTPTLLYAAGERGRVIRKTNDERSWERINVGASTNARITGGWSSGDRTVVFSTDRGVVIELVEDTWVSQTVGTRTATVPLFGVWSAARGEDLLAVGLGGAIYRRPAAKTAWTLETSPVSQDLYGIFGTAADRVFAVGARGTLLRFDGRAWIGVPSGTSSDLFAVHGLEDGSLTVAVGARGTIIILEEKK